MVGVNNRFYERIRPGKSNSLIHRLETVESKKQIRDEKDIRVRALSKAIAKESLRLGDKLGACVRNSCGSAACPLCSHLHRKWSFAECAYLSRKCDSVFMMTVLFYSEMMTDKQLFKYDFQKLMQRLRKQLYRSGFTCPVIGYLEFDYHAESSLWLPHFHLMVLGDESVAIKQFRQRFCSREKRILGGAKVSRPLHVSTLKDVGKQLSYLCKSYCARIETYFDENGKRRTKKYRLKPRQFRLSLRVLDRLGFTGRLFLYRARRNGSEICVTAVNEQIA